MLDAAGWSRDRVGALCHDFSLPRRPQARVVSRGPPGPAIAPRTLNIHRQPGPTGIDEPTDEHSPAADHRCAFTRTHAGQRRRGLPPVCAAALGRRKLSWQLGKSASPRIPLRPEPRFANSPTRWGGTKFVGHQFVGASTKPLVPTRLVGLIRNSWVDQDFSPPSRCRSVRRTKATSGSLAGGRLSPASEARSEPLGERRRRPAAWLADA